jgi:cation-transporting P-type ATPase 13A2
MSENNLFNLSIDERIKTKTTGLVVRIGFQTLKGGLIKDILFQETLTFNFVQESYWFVGGMILIALFGFTVTIPSFIKHHYTLEATILRFFDLITTAVPPALPAVLTSGIIYSIARLRQEKIYCISPTRLNVCGMIKTVVFDKTGTLTDEDLKVLGHRGVFTSTQGQIKFGCLTDDVIHNQDCCELKTAMACC